MSGGLVLRGGKFADMLRDAALWADVRDWRRYAPAAGSAFAHVVLLTGLAWALANQASRRDTLLPIPALSVQFVPDIPQFLPPPVVAATPAPAAATPGVEALPVAPQKRKPGAVPKPAPELPSRAPAVSVSPSEETLPLPPGTSDAPLGLRSLMEPCSDFRQARRPDCVTNHTETTADGRLRVAPRIEELAKLYPDFKPTPEIPIPFYHPGPGRARQSRDPKVMAVQGSMPMGPGAGTGIESIAGRLEGGPNISFGDKYPEWDKLPADVKAKVKQDPQSLTHH